ncbi:MAG TPA: nucleotidyltransferase family protein [Bryobacteraceae bacterium]|nr:nucleotidyltransferase family protein [Bryobacteraceae bacterium]
MIAGIILAAGASSRMGTPKALLDYRGETFVGRLVRVLQTTCNPVMVVLGYHADALRAGIPAGAQIVVNPDPSRGQLSSLQTALRAVPAEASGFAFIPVDSPAVSEATVARLARAFEEREASTLFVIPRQKGKRGHPVFATRAIAAELLALAATAEARDVVHAHVDRTQYVDVEDAGIFADVDDPEAYRRLKEQVP